MKQLLFILFGIKPKQKFRVLELEKRNYPIREFNQSEFDKWCNEFRVGSMWDKRIVHFDIS
jgi:hypothetical protein